MFRGMRKKFMMVLLASSGMYWDLIFIMDGQNMPTQLSKAQKPRSWMQPENEMLPPFTPEGTTKNCSTTKTRYSKMVWNVNQNTREEREEYNGKIAYRGQNGEHQSSRRNCKNNLHIALYSEWRTGHQPRCKRASQHWSQHKCCKNKTMGNLFIIWAQCRSP